MSFRTGQRVRVSDRRHEGHHRTPGYLKGRSGVVERRHGEFTNPETRAYGETCLPSKIDDRDVVRVLVADEDQVVGDRDFSSHHPVMQKLNLTAYEMIWVFLCQGKD